VVSRCPLTTRRRVGGGLLVFVAEPLEPDDRLGVLLLRTREEARLPREVNVDSKIFLVRSARRPAQQLAQIVAVRDEVQAGKVVAA